MQSSSSVVRISFSDDVTVEFINESFPLLSVLKKMKVEESDGGGRRGRMWAKEHELPQKIEEGNCLLSRPPTNPNK